MINQLSTEVEEPPYGVLMFHDKSHKLITETQFYAIIAPYSDPNTTKIQIGVSFYSKASIAKILTLEEFYTEYPTQRPEPRVNQFEKYDNLPDNIPVHALPSLVRGLKRFLDEQKALGVETPKAQALYDSYLKKLNRKQ